MAMASSRTAPPRTAWVCASCDSARNALARQFGSSPGRISERLLNVISQRITDDGYEERESRTNHSNHFQHPGEQLPQGGFRKVSEQGRGRCVPVKRY